MPSSADSSTLFKVLAKDSSALSRALGVDSSTLSKLPVELLLRIAFYLPPASAAAFSLCSKRLYALLAVPYFKCQQGHRPFSIAEFLRLLESNLPDHIVCYYCEGLHKIKPSKQHIKSSKRCDIRAKASESMQLYIYPRFSYVIFQMVMKRYRQGVDYSSLLKLLSYEKRSRSGPDTITTSFRIVDGFLLVRQRWIVVWRSKNREPDTYTNIIICPHAKRFFPHKGVGDSLCYNEDSLVRVDTPIAVECGCPQKGKMIVLGCRNCATEYSTDEFQIGRSGRAVVATRWKDLGEGKDANDLVWRKHLEEKVLPGGEVRKIGGKPICERFEREGWRRESERLLTPREITQLLKKYK